ncbi:surface-adhesin E family protein [Bordetella petrii]|nr:surface-adhesin E family protein [Bordetella petrii]
MGNGEDAEVFYAADGMQHFNGIATAWMRESFFQPQTAKKQGYQFDQVKVRRLFDCAEGTAGVMQAAMLSHGEQVDMLAFPYDLAKQTLQPVPANSFVQQVMNMACARPEAPFVRNGGPSGD